MKGRRLLIVTLLCLAVGAGLLAWKQRHAGARDSQTRKIDKQAKAEREMARANNERRSVHEFADQLRGVFEWRSQQPITQESDRIKVIRALTQKLKQVPAAELPPTYAAAWQAMLTNWAKLEQSPAPDALLQQGQQAADALNKLLVAGGYGDLQF